MKHVIILLDQGVCASCGMFVAKCELTLETYFLYLLRTHSEFNGQNDEVAFAAMPFSGD